MSARVIGAPPGRTVNHVDADRGRVLRLAGRARLAPSRDADHLESTPARLRLARKPKDLLCNAHKLDLLVVSIYPTEVLLSLDPHGLCACDGDGVTELDQPDESLAVTPVGETRVGNLPTGLSTASALMGSSANDPM